MRVSAQNIWTIWRIELATIRLGSPDRTPLRNSREHIPPEILHLVTAGQFSVASSDYETLCFFFFFARNMLASTNLVVSANSSTVPSLKHSPHARIPKPRIPFPSLPSKVAPSARGITRKHRNRNPSVSQSDKPRGLQVCRSLTKDEKPEDPFLKEEEISLPSNGERGRDWTTSVLLFLLWGAIMYYIFNLAPNQTPSRDMYFVQKLLNLKGDDGFRMNGVLVSLWNIMGLWPLVYSMLLIPTGRSSKGSVPVWPFAVLSFAGGIYALLPYFVLWKPPPPLVEEAELSRWPLKFLESKLTAGIVFLAGLGLISYAAFAGEGDWTEFFQYFRESKLV